VLKKNVKEIPRTRKRTPVILGVFQEIARAIAIAMAGSDCMKKAKISSGIGLDPSKTSSDIIRKKMISRLEITRGIQRVFDSDNMLIMGCPFCRQALVSYFLEKLC
jgi:hypothetical protein